MAVAVSIQVVVAVAVAVSIQAVALVAVVVSIEANPSLAKLHQPIGSGL